MCNMASYHLFGTETDDEDMRPFEGMREVAAASIYDILSKGVRKMAEAQEQTEKRLTELINNGEKNPVEFLDRNTLIIHKQCLQKFRTIVQETEKLLTHQGNTIQEDMENFYKIIPVKSKEMSQAKDEAAKMITVLVDDCLLELKKHEQDFHQKQEEYFRQVKQKYTKNGGTTK